jgi:hypothetical protein
VYVTIACAVLVAGCGRVGFEARTNNAGDAAGGATDAAGDGGGAQRIAWVKAIVAKWDGTSGTTGETFTVSASHASDAILLYASCHSNSMPSQFSVTAPGWTFTTLSQITGSAATNVWAASVGAIAPDVTSTSFTLTWTVTGGCDGQDDLGDEFTHNDPAGGTTTFDDHAEAFGNGTCAATVTTRNPNDAVWFACDVEGGVTALGSGFTKGADDGVNDWSEYEVTSDPANTAVLATFVGPGNFAASAVTIKPE